VCVHFKIFKTFGTGALSSKKLLVRIVENDKIDTNFRAG